MSSYTPAALKRLRKSHNGHPLVVYEFDDIEKVVDWSEFWNDGYESARAPKNVEVFYEYGEHTVSVYAVVLVRGCAKVYYGNSVFRYGPDSDREFDKEHRRNTRRTALARLYYSGTTQSVDVNLERATRYAENYTAAELRADGSGLYSVWLRAKVNKGKTLASYDGKEPESKDDKGKVVHLSKYAASTVSSYENALRKEIHSAVCVRRTGMSGGRPDVARELNAIQTVVDGVTDALGVDRCDLSKYVC